MCDFGRAMHTMHVVSPPMVDSGTGTRPVMSPASASASTAGDEGRACAKSAPPDRVERRRLEVEPIEGARDNVLPPWLGREARKERGVRVQHVWDYEDVVVALGHLGVVEMKRQRWWRWRWWRRWWRWLRW